MVKSSTKHRCLIVYNDSTRRFAKHITNNQDDQKELFYSFKTTTIATKDWLGVKKMHFS